MRYGTVSVSGLMLMEGTTHADAGTTTATRLSLALYLVSLALLPWSWFPPFPYLHEHAQWSDVVFAAAAAAWAVASVVGGWRAGKWPRLRLIHAALGLYLGAATLSLLLASANWQAGAWKFLGMMELCLLVVITSDLASRPRVSQAITRVVAVTSLVTSIAAIAGLALFYAGVETNLIGSYGDLVATKWYARVQAGLYHPNLLASFCIFAAAVVACDNGALPAWLRRVVQTALWVTVLLTFSRGILAFSVAAAIRAARTVTMRRLAGVYAVACVVIIASLTIWNLSLDPTRPLEMRFNPSETSSRWQTATSSFRTLNAHPILGSGLGTHPGWYRGSPFDAHLTPLNIAATMGLPALAGFTWLIVILWRRRGRPADIAIWSGFAGFALDALASDIEDFRHVWVLIGLADADSIKQPER